MVASCSGILTGQRDKLYAVMSQWCVCVVVLLQPRKFEHELSERLTRPGVAVGEEKNAVIDRLRMRERGWG